MVSTTGEDGALGRFEFVAACEALLADTPGCASAADLHELFDILDPQCTGQVSLQEFSRLLQAYRQVPKAVDGHTAAVRLLEEQRGIAQPEPGPGLVLSPLAGLRAWMLQHAWIFQDLEALLGDPRGELDWSDFAGRLLSRVRTPWLTRQGVADIFAQLQVRASNSMPGQMQPVVRVPDLVQALLGSEDFALEAARRVLRVVAREARHRRQDVGKLCLRADTKRVGNLNLQQLSSVLSGLCPGMLAEADVGLLFWRFSGSGGFSYEQLEAALKEERNAASEHLLLRGLPVLIDKAAEFEEKCNANDASRTGKLSVTQLRGALSQLNLFADMTELDEFIELLAEACQRDASNFNYASLVVNGTWKGPSVKDAIATVCGESEDPPPAGKPSKRHLLSILYYKTAEASKKLGLSRQRAFEGLDRGNKGFLNAEDLRAGVLQVVGGDETLTLKDLGLAPATRLTFLDFEKRLNFDFAKLTRYINEVFGDQAVISESDFTGRLSEFAGIDKATSQTWLQLMYPEGLPAEGVGRGACEIFLATTPASAPAEGAQQFRPGPDVRAELMKDAEAAGIAGQLPAWVATPRARSLLRSRMSEKEADEILQLIGEASAKYPPPGPEEVVAGTSAGQTEAPVRSETLLLCVERAKAAEHILEVSFKSIDGFEKAAEVFLRYSCHGTSCVADVPRVQSVDFNATHVFALSEKDSLACLFEGRNDALTIQAWISVTKGELRRPLAAAVLPASELQDFLKASMMEKPRPEVLLGSQKKWTLDFLPLAITDPTLKKPPAAAVTGSLEVMVHHRRRPVQDPQRIPLPWSSSFAGRLVVCRKGVASVGLNDPEEAPSGLAPREEEPPKPPPGSIVIQVTISGLVLQADALRGLVARCLQGQLLAAPGSVGGLASKAPQLFARLCLFPGKPKMQVAGCGGWVESSIKPVPEMLLLPSSKGDAKVMFDFTWSSPPLEATQAVEALQDGTLALEVWIRHPAADLRLSEKTLKLQGLLEAVSPEDTSELRLRTLQPAKLEISAAFERDGKALANLSPGSTVELQLPNGPGTLSWLLEKPKAPKVEETMRANYSVHLREIIMSGDFVAHLAGHEDVTAFQPRANRTSQSQRRSRQEQQQFVRMSKEKDSGAEIPLFYLEMVQGDSQLRSAPIPGTLDGFRWIRISPGEETVLPLPGRFVLNGGPPGEETRKRDAALLRGDRHKVTLRLLQISANSSKVAAQADAQLPIGWFVEGVPAPYFGGHQWVPLLHISQERPWTSVIGRALLRVQADRSGGGRMLRQVPLAPAGLFLPLYKDWQGAKGPSEPPPQPRQWHLEVVIKLIAGEELWQRLTGAETRINAMPSGTFQSILRSAAEQVPSVLFSSPDSPNSDSSSTRIAMVQGDLAFLSTSIAPIMADPEVLVPTRQLILWISLRCLARWTLPVAQGLVQRLSQIDFGEERGQRTSRETSGAVSLSTFQSVLQAELRKAGVADLPAALWQLISQRTEWQAGGQWHFDYLLFLWDLQAACGSASSVPGIRIPPPAMSPMPAPAVREVPSIMLTIQQAFHLPYASGPPSAFVSYAWRCDKGLNEPPSYAGTNDVLGSTKAIEFSSSPTWNHTVALDLPEVTCGEATLPYPEAFRHLYLELWVWHAGRTQSEDVLIGGSEVSLVPLKSGYEVDGYFHVLAPEDVRRASELDVLKNSRGQLRVSVSAAERSHGGECHAVPQASPVSEMKMRPMDEDFWPFRPAPGIGLPADQDLSALARPPVLTVDPSSGRKDRNSWSPNGSPLRAPTAPSSWRPWEPPLPETWGCPRGPLAEQLWKLGLRPDGPDLPGVENDVSETALRAASKLSDTELQLRSLAGNEGEQLRQLRARHQQNLESLGMLQKSMLLPTATVTPSDKSITPVPPVSARDADLSPSLQWGDGAPLQDLVAASAADGLGLASPGIASLSAGPLPRCAEWLGSRAPAMAAATVIPQESGTAPNLFETAGPLPPPTLSDTGEDAFPAEGGPGESETGHRTEETTAPLARV